MSTDPAMRVSVRVTGPLFAANQADLSRFVKVLRGYAEMLGACLGLAARARGGQEGFNAKSLIKIQGMSADGLEVRTRVEASAPLVGAGGGHLALGYGLNPALLGEAWDLLRNGLALTRLATDFFHAQGRAPGFRAQAAGPGEPAIRMSGDNHELLMPGEAALHAARDMQKGLGDVLAPLAEGAAEVVEFRRDGDEDAVRIGQDDYQGLVVPSRKLPQGDAAPVIGQIYALNLKTGKGQMTLEGEGGQGHAPFTIAGGAMVHYIAALSQARTRFMARGSRSENALGQTKTARLFLEGVIRD